MSKAARQSVIMDVLGSGPLPNQDELRKKLRHRGLTVTQATLSRDIHEMGLVKTPEGYSLPETVHNIAEARRPSTVRLVREFVREVREAQNLLVLKTTVGSAQPVAAALDSEQWPECVGTIAGDDSILIVSTDRKAAKKLAERIREMLE
jgi:transcriptional regulator of arginine metabolism